METATEQLEAFYSTEGKSQIALKGSWPCAGSAEPSQPQDTSAQAVSASPRFPSQHGNVGASCAVAAAVPL